MPFDEASALISPTARDITASSGAASWQLANRRCCSVQAGGCGSAAVQIAKATGASVVAVAGGAEKCALASQEALLGPALKGLIIKRIQQRLRFVAPVPWTHPEVAGQPHLVIGCNLYASTSRN